MVSSRGGKIDLSPSLSSFILRRVYCMVTSIVSRTVGEEEVDGHRTACTAVCVYIRRISHSGAHAYFLRYPSHCRRLLQNTDLSQAADQDRMLRNE